MSSQVPDDAPKPRLGHLKKWPDFNGYGFNLHAEKGKVGQYIGKVDPGSPAYYAGLKQGDRIVEVNGTNIANENHQQVVQRIKAVPNETKMLVVDAQTEKYYKDKKIVIRGDMPSVVVHVCPATKPAPGSSPVTTNGLSDGPSNQQARLCDLRTWPDFQGYGFNLHAEKGKPGQFIGKVDHGSPAFYAGLREGDRIVEVNGINIKGDMHKDVVQKIKQHPNEVKMLVVDKDTDTYFTNNNISVSGSSPQVVVITCPETRPSETEVISTTVVASVESSPPSSGATHPRACHLKKWEDFQGYGFNLHAEKGKPGQFIGSVDDDSPAKLAGLRENDKIIEVNGASVAQMSHSEVVQKIKSDPNQVKLLVIDKEGEQYYKNLGLTIHGDMEVVETIVCPDSKPTSAPAVVPAPVPAPVVTTPDIVENENVPQARLCYLKKWDDFQGYGFNLQAERGKVGQYVGTIDEGSPAEVGGVLTGDRIIEVNGVPVTDAPHHDVVQLIRDNPTGVRMLVVTREDEEYFNEQNMTISGTMPNIKEIHCPDQKPAHSPAPYSNHVDTSAPRLRKCLLKTWPSFEGYGFTLRAFKGVTGHFIADIDPGSPAEAAGLREADRIIEVNGNNAENLEYAEVASIIHSNNHQVELLVVSKYTEDYYNERNIAMHGNLSSIKVIECPDIDPSAIANATYVNGVDTPAQPPPATATTAAIVTTSTPPPSLRLCHLKRWSNYQGYGFNMVAQKQKAGQLIVGIDSGSPADLGGLRNKDKVLEVNGVDALLMTHQQVVEQIKHHPDHVKMLVSSPEVEEYYSERNIVPSASVCNIETIICPDEAPTATAVKDDIDDGMARVSVSPDVSASHAHAPRLRLCHIRRWDGYAGYGFNLIAKKGQSGQFISSVDRDSPADLSGLRDGDKIIEVNGVNVTDMSHQETVHNIKTNPRGVSLLVADSEAEAYYTERNIKMDGSMSNIEIHQCPDLNPEAQQNGAVQAEVAAVQVNHVEENGDASENLEEVHEEIVTHVEERVPTPEPPREPSPEPYREPTPEIEREPSPEPEVREETPTPEPPQQPSPSPPREATPEPEEHEIPEPEHGHVAMAISSEDISDAEEVEDYVETHVEEEPEEEEHEELKSEEEEEEEAAVDSYGTAVATTTYVHETIEDANANHYVEPEPKKEPEPAPAPAPAPVVTETRNAEPVRSTPASVGGMEFAGSAKEARERMLGKKKKVDPRQSTLNMREKYELFQKL